MTTTAAVPAAYAIEACDITKLDGADMSSLARLHQDLSHERIPEEPLTPLDLIERRLRNRPDVADTKDWVVQDGGEVMAVANVTRWKTGTNPHWRDMWIGVHPERRRRGIATRLLRRIVDAAAGDDDIILASTTNDRTGGAGFARATGASEGLNNRTSEVRLADIDSALIAEWARLEPASYRLVWLDEDIPDELMANVIAAYDTMNTAPRGDLQHGDWHTTAEEIRDWERVRRSNGGIHRLLLAIHDATGATAGFTEVNRHPQTPWLVNQLGTAVVPAHRGHGIGKWIKARMIDRILREWPDAQFIRTGNAYLNAPMLSINDRIGFKVIFSVVVWQLKITDARKYLEARGV